MPTVMLDLTVTWSNGIVNPNNVIALDSQFAYVTVSNTSNFYFRFSTNAESVIPGNSVITGVRLALAAHANTLAPGPRASAGMGDFGGTSDIQMTTGSTFYYWGGTGNPLGITSVSGLSTCSIKYGNNVAGTCVQYFDVLQVHVDWMPPSAKNPSLFFGTNF